MSADTMIQQMASVYAGCSSYEDEGLVDEIFHPGSPEEHRTHRAFRTYFKRPNLFRFEWTEKRTDVESRGERFYILWSDGTGVYCHYPWHRQKVKNLGDLHRAIGAATAFSGGAAHTIPVLLIPSLPGVRLTELTHVNLIGEEHGNGLYHLNGNHPRMDYCYEFWIEKQDFLLRKLKHDHVIAEETFLSDEFQERLEPEDSALLNLKTKVGVRVVSECVYRSVQVNQDIPADMFHWDPPSPKS